MKRWQIILFSFLGVAIIGGAGYIGSTGQLPVPFGQQAEPTQVEAPPTVPVSHGDVEKTIITPGQLVNYSTIDLPAQVSGPIAEINVRPGESVTSGQVLARIGGQEALEAELAEAEIAVLEAQQALDAIYTNAGLHQAEAQQAISDAQQALDALAVDAPVQQAEAMDAIANAQQAVLDAEYQLSSLTAPADEASLAAAKSDVTLLKERLVKAEKAYAPYRSKPDSNLNKARTGGLWADAKQAYDAAVRQLNSLTGTATDLVRAKAEAGFALAQAQLAQAQATYDALQEGVDPVSLAIAEAELELAQMAYDTLEEGIDPTGLASAQANLTKAEVDLSLAQARVEALEITAPFDGVVLEVSVREGETVNDGSQILQMAAPQDLEVLTSVIEEDYPLVQVGQPVDIFFDAAPEVEATGRIDRIVPVRASDDRPLYRVYISIDDAPDVLVEGMTADAAVILESRTDVLRLPRSLVRATSDGSTTVTVWVGDHEESRTITTGLRGDLYVEILTGLEAGDLVVGQ